MKSEDERPLRPAATEAGRERRLQVLERFLTPARQANLEHALRHRVRNVAMVVDGITDLGNASAIMRCCEGHGVYRLFLIEKVKRFKPACRSALGSHKWLEIRRFNDVSTCVEAVRAQGFRLFGASLEGSTEVRQMPVDGPLALVFGNEHAGLSDEMLAACDGFFRIAMHGVVQSYNVAVAVGIALHEVLGRRAAMQAHGRWGDLDAVQMDVLREIYYRKAVANSQRILEHSLGEVPALPQSSGSVFEMVEHYRR